MQLKLIREPTIFVIGGLGNPLSQPIKTKAFKPLCKGD